MWVGLGLCGFAWSRLIWVVGCDLGCGLIWLCVWRRGGMETTAVRRGDNASRGVEISFRLVLMGF